MKVCHEWVLKGAQLHLWDEIVIIYSHNTYICYLLKSLRIFYKYYFSSSDLILMQFFKSPNLAKSTNIPLWDSKCYFQRLTEISVLEALVPVFPGRCQSVFLKFLASFTYLCLHFSKRLWEGKRKPCSYQQGLQLWRNYVTILLSLTTPASCPSVSTFIVFQSAQHWDGCQCLPFPIPSFLDVFFFFFFFNF